MVQKQTVLEYYSPQKQSGLVWKIATWSVGVPAITMHIFIIACVIMDVNGWLPIVVENPLMYSLYTIGHIIVLMVASLIPLLTLRVAHEPTKRKRLIAFQCFCIVLLLVDIVLLPSLELAGAP